MLEEAQKYNFLFFSVSTKKASSIKETKTNKSFLEF